MAGIGFVLRKLYRKDDLLSLISIGLHSAFASTGPWLFTVLALGAITVFGKHQAQVEAWLDFRTILIYNFSFSLLLSGPVYMIATRYIADCIYRRDVSSAPGMLLQALLLLWAGGLIIAPAFYFLYAKLTPMLALSAVINFLLLSAVWLVSVFISALKNYHRITSAFICGMSVAVLACTYLAHLYGAAGMLNGFSLGICVILGLLLGSILAEYPYPLRFSRTFLGYFHSHWEIALSGLVYNMAIWVDKWIMWFSPDAVRLPNRLLTYPHYDSAMFIAYLSTVPAMAMFLFNAETHFFERYLQFYRDIEQKANLSRIRQNHEAILKSIFGNAGHFLLLQSGIALVGLLLAPGIISVLHGDYLQIGMLRYGLLGALFNVLTLFLLILLSYFDNRRANLYIQLVFLVTNALFTWVSIHLGFRYYGYGYFLSSFLTFLLAAIAATHYAARLPYHTFITTNASIRANRLAEAEAIEGGA